MGGHCIGVDPYYLTFKAKQIGYSTNLISAGRNINDYMHKYLLEKILFEINLRKKVFKIEEVLLLGISYKSNCGDIRNSQLICLVENLITQYKTTCKRSFGKDYDEVINDLHQDNKVRGAFCNLMPSIEISGIIKKVLPIVQDTLQLPRNRIRIRLMCDTLIAPKNETIYKKSVLSDYDDALRFHRDFDGLRFLKYFILLSECDKDNGAHYLVKGSPKKVF